MTIGRSPAHLMPVDTVSEAAAAIQSASRKQASHSVSVCLCLRVCLSVRSHPSLPPQLAWIFSTRPVFLYPELLPLVSLDPELYCPRRTQAFTAAEDW